MEKDGKEDGKKIRRKLVEKILQSRNFGLKVKGLFLGSLLTISSNTAGAKAASLPERDAEAPRVAQTIRHLPSSVVAGEYEKLKKFADFEELSPAQTGVVGHTYIVDHNVWIEHDSIVIKCVDSRYVQQLSLTDVACARECKPLDKSKQSADGYISFNRDPGVIGNDGKATYNGIISTDFNATRQSIVLMYCHPDKGISALGQQMINGDYQEIRDRLRRQIYPGEGRIADSETLVEVFNSKDFALLRGKIKNQTNRRDFNLMYQKVCRSDVESSLAFQEIYALTFYGVGRKGNLRTLNERIKKANGGKADLSKVRPAVIGAALSEMIAKGHGTLAASPEKLKLSVLNNTSLAGNITNAGVLGATARKQADKMSEYDYLTENMLRELLAVTGDSSFFTAVYEKIQAHEAMLAKEYEKHMENMQTARQTLLRDALRIEAPKKLNIRPDVQQIKKSLHKEAYLPRRRGRE